MSCNSSDSEASIGRPKSSILAFQNSIYPKDDCYVCLSKLFPDQHGTADEKAQKRRADAAPRLEGYASDFDVFKGSDCEHMVHWGCVNEFFRNKARKRKEQYNRLRDVIAACPLCNGKLQKNRLRRVWMRGLCGGDVVIVNENILRHNEEANPYGVGYTNPRNEPPERFTFRVPGPRKKHLPRAKMPKRFMKERSIEGWNHVESNHNRERKLPTRKTPKTLIDDWNPSDSSHNGRRKLPKAKTDSNRRRKLPKTETVESKRNNA